MSRFVFDWDDEDPGALIVLVLALSAVLFVPWQCDMTKTVGSKGVAVASNAAPTQGSP